MPATERITIYVTKSEKKAIYASAKAHGEHASGHAKRLLLSHLSEHKAARPNPGGSSD